MQVVHACWMHSRCVVQCMHARACCACMLSPSLTVTVHASCRPSASSPGAELPGSYLAALAQEGGLALLLAGCDGLEPQQLLGPMVLANRLAYTGQPAFVAQFVQV